MTVHADMKTRMARVMLKPDQIKYAIGKNGNNIHLAERLTGYEIDVYRDVIDKTLEDPNDIDIIEFREEFGDDMIYQLLDSGLDTAKKVLQAGIEEIEQALLGPTKIDEMSVFGKGRKTVKPRERRLTDEEKRYWKKIAENIYRTVKDQFNEADLQEINDEDNDAAPEGEGADEGSEKQ